MDDDDAEQTASCHHDRWFIIQSTDPNKAASKLSPFVIDKALKCSVLTAQIVFRQKGLLSIEKRKLLEVEAQQIRNRTFLTAASMRVLSMFDIPKLGSMSPQITKFINHSISKHKLSIMKSTPSLIMFL